ncbi:hypothetical protein AgCh_028462 [Apium graveolens]
MVSQGTLSGSAEAALKFSNFQNHLARQNSINSNSNSQQETDIQSMKKPVGLALDVMLTLGFLICSLLLKVNQKAKRPDPFQRRIEGPFFDSEVEALVETV